MRSCEWVRRPWAEGAAFLFSDSLGPGGPAPSPLYALLAGQRPESSHFLAALVLCPAGVSESAGFLPDSCLLYAAIVPGISPRSPAHPVLWTCFPE